MKIKFIFLVFLVGWMSCAEENYTPAEKYSVSGFAQKGPFIKGSQIEISELSESLNQTGKVFKSELMNDLGEFQINELALESSIIELTADGYYYNEVNGILSQSRLILKSLSDISGRERINVNIMTHLIIDRVKVLLEAGNDFQLAKETAQKELLASFNLDTNDIGDFEDMDISNQLEKNGILLAISSIFQGQNNVGELSKLLADFKEDFSDNGLIDNANIHSELFNNARLLDTIQLRSHMVQYYNSKGLSVEVPDFGGHINTFIDSSNIVASWDISYPATGSYGENLLAKETNTHIDQGVEYSITAIFPTELELLVRLKMNEMDTIVSWSADVSKQTNWIGIPKNGEEIVAEGVGVTADMSIIFSGTGDIELQLESFKKGMVDEYLGTRQIILTIQ